MGAVVLSGIPAATLLSNGVGAGQGLRSGHWSLGQGVGQRRLQPCLWLGGTSLLPLAETSCHSGHKPLSQSRGPSKPSLWLGSSQMPGWLAPHQQGARGPVCPGETVGCGTPTFPETPPSSQTLSAPFRPKFPGDIIRPGLVSQHRLLSCRPGSPQLSVPTQLSRVKASPSRPTCRGEGLGVFQAASK